MNCVLAHEISTPFTGYKQSGIGSDLGQHALDTFVSLRTFVIRISVADFSDSYTQVKSVHVNIGMKL